jgi:aspartate-semialdehyde dehydrogenase
MKRKKYNIAIVGATGLVGRKMLTVLQERNIPIERLMLFASERSVGKPFEYRGSIIKVQKLEPNCFENLDFALFSAGKDVSLEYAPISAAYGCTVIDNSSAWRMDSCVPLVVPEVNPEDLANHKGIIANPNCSTIQLVVILKPIHEILKLKRVVVSTYQSISGAGQKGLDKLYSEVNDLSLNIKNKIAYNTLFHPIYDNDGFSVEEIKMINETRRILHFPYLPIAVTCVRLPTVGGHGESVNIETDNPFDLDELRNIIKKQRNTVLLDSPLNDVYPTPEISNDKDEVFVGRIRKDLSVPNGAYLWIVADNVRKGAATNAVQILEYLINHNL